MITGSSSCFPTTPQGLQVYAVSHQEDVGSSSLDQATSTTAAPNESHSANFLYNISLLKDKIHQVQSLANFFVSPDQNHQPSESTAIAIASIGYLIQEIIVTATSVMYTCHQMALDVGSSSANNDNNNNNNNNCTEDLNLPGSQVAKHLDPGSLPQSFDVNRVGVSRFVQEEKEHGLYGSESLDWFPSDSYNTTYTTRNSSITHVSNKNTYGGARALRNSSVTYVSNTNDDILKRDLPPKRENTEGLEQLSPRNYDIVELDAADILAKYTHYCQECGKGFKRDANLRMHMRAHGDEYKSSAALSNPMKNNGGGEERKEDGILQRARKYSCPQEGCRWNKKHAKFQPLKSMICVKNHYKRSHCPKMYVCKRCNRKQFSVLSDLRTHEKHCGDLKWQCSCGTTFSRKDKLMGHVALFVGHTPAISSLARMGKADPNALQIQLEDR